MKPNILRITLACNFDSKNQRKVEEEKYEVWVIAKWIGWFCLMDIIQNNLVYVYMA